jgi:iron complex transport system ATP-binding protein
MHDLDAAARVATRVVMLRGGRVVASGPPGEVMTPARLGETFDVELDAVVHGPSGARVFVALRAQRPAR